MRWDKLINDKRFGLEHLHDDGRRGGRSEFRRDYDRLVFSSPSVTVMVFSFGSASPPLRT